MKSRKGFTLIELLVVILILGVIALIAIPTVSNIIKESKKNAFKTGIQNIIKAAETQCLKEQLQNQRLTSLYTFSSDGVVGALEVKGTLPTDGTISLDGTCKTEVAVSNKDFCANKSFESDEIEVVELKNGECVGFSNNVKNKINISFEGNEKLSFNNLTSSVNEKNELVYEFTLKNNTTDALNYKLYFNNDNTDVFKYVDMQVIKDYVVEYNSSLTSVTNDNEFEIANIEPGDEISYKILFKANSVNFNFDGVVNINDSVISDIPNRVTVTMAKNSKTEKNFTWHTTENTGYVQVVKANNKNKSIASFNGSNVIEVNSTVGNDSFSEYVHKAKITNLEPGTEYYYRVGNKESNIWSNVGKFTTDNGDNSFSFVYMADLQSGTSGLDAAAYTIMKSMEKSKNAEFLLNVGDFVNTPTVYDEWKGILEYNSFGNITTVAASGNHDYNYNEKGEYVFDQHFNYDLTEGVNPESGAYYSFNYGNVHFTILNANDYEWWMLSENQTEWLKNDLASSQDKDFRIVGIHRGPYTPGSHFYDYGDIKILTEQLTPIFAEYNVDLVLQGHDHTYGLTYPINGSYEKVNINTQSILSKETNKNINAMLRPGSPVYYINNAAGSKYNSTLKLVNGEYISANPNQSVNINATKEEIDAFYSKFQKIDTPMKEDGTNLALFSSIEVKGKTLLVNTYSVDNQNKGEVTLYDSFGITK